MEEIAQLLHKGMVVATSAMLAERLGTSDARLKDNFNENKTRYEEGVHFFLLKGTELKEFKNYVGNSDLVQIDKRTPHVYLWTEKGAFNHVKSLGTDEAWDAFKHLVDTYFNARALADNIKQNTRRQKQIESYVKKGKNPDWIKDGMLSIGSRNQLTSTLKKHGVEHEGYRNITNTIYDTLYGGSSNVVREKKGLTKNQNIRDNLPQVELKTVEMIEVLTADTIEKEDLHGNAQCEIAAKRVGKAIATAIMQTRRL